jgi:glycosyltransferase involved in cell wall biosynthesis
LKKVLVISYYFPPSGGPGVQRVLKFVKYLPQFGWEPIVLTVDGGDFPARDESLLQEIPPTTKVYRTKIFEPYRLYRKLTGKPDAAPVDVENIPLGNRKRSLTEAFAGFIRETIFIPDARIGWFPYAIPRALEIIRNENVDALYSSSPPYSTAVIARELHKRTSLPWIAGFRDPWIGFISSPDRWALPRTIDKYLERSVYEEANLVECAWQGIARDFQAKYPHVNPVKCIYLPNGFDPDDFPPGDVQEHKRFTVTYTGSMYGRRNPETFLRAVDELVAEGKVDPRKILLKFIGRFGAEVKAMVDRAGVRSSTEIVPYAPHRESIKELLQADCLLLIVDESKESAEIVPGKVFEYLGARRPILALAQEGAIAELIRETRSGVVVPNQDLASIKRAFIENYENFLYHKKTIEFDSEKIRQYDRREITRRLAGLLDYLQNQRLTHH